jgi:4-amino-4-deoxy-L-arabinose transferase-like glycosyltransferase
VAKLNQRSLFRLLVFLMLAAWCAGAWLALRPAEIASDWNGWRQTDTQTIALNFLKPGASVLRPEINWGGDGPGYVETEFQLYTKISAVLMGVFGKGVWAGQLVSLLAIFGTGVVLWFHLGRRHPPWAAAAGVLAFLCARTSPHLATVVMPDALALLAYAAAWACFCLYLERGRHPDVVAFALLGALAMLTKPTTAHLGISTFLMVLLTDRRRLRDYRLWVAWAFMVLATALYLAYAHHFYTEYGNTFGLLAGEDSKTPKLRHLLMPKVLLGAVKNMAGWGLGHLAALALVLLAIRRRLQAEHWALLAGNVVITLVALRYMSQDAGNYYFAPAGVLAASAVAALATQLGAWQARWRPIALGVLVVGLCVQGGRNLKVRHVYGHWDDPEVARVVATGKEIDRLTNPGDLIFVRSPNEAFDVFWQSGRNYHEPRIFYLSGTRGWTMGREQEDLKLVEDAVRRGARFFADPLTDRSAVLDGWLAANAELVWSPPEGGRIWRFRPRAR